MVKLNCRSNKILNKRKTSLQKQTSSARAITFLNKSRKSKPTNWVFLQSPSKLFWRGNISHVLFPRSIFNNTQLQKRVFSSRRLFWAEHSPCDSMHVMWPVNVKRFHCGFAEYANIILPEIPPHDTREIFQNWRVSVCGMFHIRSFTLCKIKLNGNTRIVHLATKKHKWPRQFNFLCFHFLVLTLFLLPFITFQQPVRPENTQPSFWSRNKRHNRSFLFVLYLRQCCFTLRYLSPAFLFSTLLFLHQTCAYMLFINVREFAGLNFSFPIWEWCSGESLLSGSVRPWSSIDQRWARLIIPEQPQLTVGLHTAGTPGGQKRWH